MQLADLKRPRFYIPITLLVVIAIISAVVFNPGFQKKMLLRYAGPLLDSLQVEYIHFTPWSLRFDKLSVDYAGGHFAAEQGTLRYCLSSLLLLTANIKQLALRDVDVDVSNFNPPPTEEPETDTLFPGVLASLRHGLGYSLQDVDINAHVVLPDQQSMTASITGGIKPKATGSLNMEAAFLTGKEGEQIGLKGDITLDQLTRGRFNAITTTLAIDAALQALPEAETANVTLLVTPAPPTETEQLALEAGGEEPAFTPEALHLKIVQNDAQGAQRSGLTLDGRYDGNNGDFAGSYRVTANERLVQRYVKDTQIPPSKEALSGDLLFNTKDTTGDITVISELLMQEIDTTRQNENLPELLRLENNFRLSLLPGLRLQVQTLDSGLTDEESTVPLASSLPGELDIPLRDIKSFMHQENTLLAFELPEVPLKWFDIFLSGQELTQGTLSAAFEITTDTEGAIHVIPDKPLTVTGLTLMEQDQPVFKGLNLSVLPRVSYRGDVLDVRLDELQIDGGKGDVATANMKATVPLGDEPGAILANAAADLNLPRLVELLAIEQSGRQSLPERMSLDFQTAIQQRPGAVVVNSLDANLLLNGKTRLVHAGLTQPLLLNSTDTGTRIGNAAGKLATLNISAIQLGWFSAFVPETTLKGRLRRADFDLVMDADGVATLAPTRAVSLAHVSVSDREGALLKDVSATVQPTVRLAPDATHISYRDLKVTAGRTALLTGHGALTLPATEDKPMRAEGRLDVDVQALSRQPVVARSLQGSVEAPVSLKADYKLAQGKSSIDLERLSAQLFYADKQPRVSLQADSRVRVRTQLGRRQSELGRARGKVTLRVDNLTPEPFAGILAANGLAFKAANGRAVMDSDGKSLRIDTLEPFTVTGVSVSADDKTALEPFTLTLDTETVMQGDRLHARVKQLNIVFDDAPDVSALDTDIDVTLKGRGEATWIENLVANVRMDLPPLLDQPAVLPGHGLKAGDLTSVTTLDASGRLESTTRVQNLKGREALPLELLEIRAEGQLDADGSFEVAVPVHTRGKSGESDLLGMARHVSRQGENDDLTISIDGEVFYLNDILNTLNAITGKGKAEKSTKKVSEEQQAADEAEKQARGLQPDERAFWDVIPYNRHATYHLKRLFYTDYLEIFDITGRAEITPARLSVEEFSARFHNSPIVLNAVLAFTPGDQPYDLDMKASTDKFDLATFLRELDPDSIPPAEGLFDVKIDAFGKSPNMTQYRNNLFFDMRLHSRDGVFRLLDPNDPLVTGSSTFVGAVGEGVSYVPTGLFGLGAVSRLVNYIKEVPYDKISMHLVRDESRDVQIRQYVVQSPEILMTATGGIDYKEGVDILQSPLKMDAQLNLRDRGAAIFYDLDLLGDEEDKYGYWVGPEIRFWGTLTKTDSNLGDIIEAAGKGAVLGGITRPVSGLIGNVRHLWVKDKDEPKEYDDEHEEGAAETGVANEEQEPVDAAPATEAPAKVPPDSSGGYYTDFPDILD